METLSTDADKAFVLGIVKFMELFVYQDNKLFNIKSFRLLGIALSQITLLY